jgi:hypothetical protein
MMLHMCKPLWVGFVVLVGACASGSGKNDGAVTDTAVAADAVAPDLVASDAGGVDARSIGVAADGGRDAAADLASEATPRVPPSSCDGVQVSSQPISVVVEGTVTANRWAGGGITGGCEGDIPGLIEVNRILCGAISSPAKVAALTDPAPIHSGPLVIGERRLFLMDLSRCPAYPPGNVYQIYENRPPADWDVVAAMLGTGGDR